MPIQTSYPRVLNVFLVIVGVVLLLFSVLRLDQLFAVVFLSMAGLLLCMLGIAQFLPKGILERFKKLKQRKRKRSFSSMSTFPVDKCKFCGKKLKISMTLPQHTYVCDRCYNKKHFLLDLFKLVKKAIEEGKSDLIIDESEVIFHKDDKDRKFPLDFKGSLKDISKKVPGILNSFVVGELSEENTIKFIRAAEKGLMKRLE